MFRFNLPALQLLLSSVIFGVGAIFVVFLDFHPAMIAFYRLFIGAVLFGILLVTRRQTFAIQRPALLYAMLSGAMLGVDLMWWNESILLVGPGIATILNSLQIFVMAGLGALFYREKISLPLLFSLFVSFLGVVLLCSNELQTNAQGTRGVIVGILSAVAFALSMFAMKKATNHQTSGLMNTMFYASVGGTLALGIYANVTSISFAPTAPQSWPLMVIYACGVHVFAWYLMAKAIAHLRVAVVGLLVSFEPVVAFLVDFTFLDKGFSGWQLLGALLTIGAIYWGSQVKKA